MKKIVCMLALVSLLALIGCGGVPTKSGTASTAAIADSPTLAVKAQLAFADAKVAADLIDSITAKADGSVIITLNQTSAAIAGDAGANGAKKLGAAYNARVLDKVPEANSVATLDADNTVLELSTRK